jgi:hypothetical protein
MAKKRSTEESWGPYYETYIKHDAEGNAFEQEVPCYREVVTPYGTVGVPAKHKLSFDVQDDGEKLKITPKFTRVASAKVKKPAKVGAKAAADAPAEQE